MADHNSEDMGPAEEVATRQADPELRPRRRVRVFAASAMI